MYAWVAVADVRKRVALFSTRNAYLATPTAPQAQHLHVATWDDVWRWFTLSLSTGMRVALRFGVGVLGVRSTNFDTFTPLPSACHRTMAVAWQWHVAMWDNV